MERCLTIEQQNVFSLKMAHPIGDLHFILLHLILLIKSRLATFISAFVGISARKTHPARKIVEVIVHVQFHK